MIIYVLTYITANVSVIDREREGENSTSVDITKDELIRLALLLYARKSTMLNANFPENFDGVKLLIYFLLIYLP